MTIEFLRLIFDIGTLVLIWLVQLVIYPSFLYYSPAQLLEWHQLYTSRVTYVVMPLMLGQLIVILIQLWLQVDWYMIASFCLVFFLWASTFLQFIPMHHKITTGNFENELLVRLVKKNWSRTFAWSLLAVLTLVKIIVF